MGDRQAVSARPWHLWAVGFATLAWNAIACFSYTMTRLGRLDDLGMSEVEIAYFAQAPVWSNAAWALGVWGALAGSILLLARSRYAVMAVAVAIVGLLGSNIWQYALSDMPESLRNPGLPVAIWITTLFMLFYVSRMTRAGVLR